ncbi:MAG: Glu/Leu/Phe/Val dehydrogenase [Thermodesulfobacteriota bacterium]
MEAGFTSADELGPIKEIYVQEPSIGLKATLVVDNVAMGPSIGGVRMAPDVSTEECARLARAMTLKNAAAGLDHGGGKLVLYGDAKMDLEKKEQLIRCLACALRGEEHYIFGPDMGTDERAMAWVKDEIGRSVGLPRELGGIPLDEIGATGMGVDQAAEIGAEFADLELNGARLAVQGFGAVGKHAARFLAKRGVILVATADSSGTIYNPDGLDIEELITLKQEGKSVADYAKGERLPRGEIIDIACDIWIPAARPDVINGNNVHRLQTRLVVEGANIPITHGAEKYLHDKGILCIPDFIANAGGVICAAMEYAGASEKAALETIEEKVRTNTSLVLEKVREKQITPREAAMELAIQRLQKAMELKRWHLF